MYNVNFISDDIVSSMGYAVPFKEMAGKTITAVGACIMDVDDKEITFIKGDDDTYYSGSSEPVRKSVKALLKIFTEELEKGEKKASDFKYTVTFDEGGSGSRKYIIAKCKKA